MISVILTAGDDEKALARMLAALVPGAAEGLVRDVAVLGANGPSAAVADDAGADLYEAGAFAEAIRRARGAWLMGVPLTRSLATHWIEPLNEHLSRNPAEPARLVARGFALMPLPDGWLLPKPRVASAAGAREQDFQRLARRSGRSLRILARA